MRQRIDEFRKQHGVLSDERIKRNRQNASLPKDAWEQIDGAVIEPFKAPNMMVTDLMNRNLDLDIPFHVLLSEWQDITDMSTPQRTLDGMSNRDEDALIYNLNTVPVPVTHKEYSIATRTLEASQASDVEALDITLPSAAGRAIRDDNENLVANGDATLSVNNGSGINGYTTHPQRNTITIANAWDTSTPGNPYAIDDTSSMIQAMYDDNKFGPFGMYLPKNYWGPMQRDYSPEAGVTWVDRILEFADIEFVHLGRSLADDNVVLVDLNRDTVDLAVARMPTTISWESGDGFVTHFKSFDVMVPRIKTDADNRCGIVHASV